MSMEDFVKTLSNEQKDALLKALNEKSGATQNVPEEVNRQAKRALNNSFIAESKPKENNNYTQQRRREPVKARENTWTDTGEFRDIETPQYERTPRKRPTSQKSEVECHVCGKDFKVDKKFVFGEYYRCNKCSSRR
jgi:DNA-directed RNA polymerase subunit RPC12/RpoP